MTKIKIVVGSTLFRATIADTIADWLVIEDMGNDIFKAETTKESGYGGSVDVFEGKVIRSAIANERHQMDEDRAASEWIAALQPGSFIHYDNGFGEYVRYEVVKGRQVQLRAVALIGKWKQYDLPRRQEDGSIYYGFYPERIRSGELVGFPHLSNILESPIYSNRSKVNIALVQCMLPIDLTVPDMTPDEASKAELEKIIQQISNLVTNGEWTAQQRLESVYMLVSGPKAKSFMRPAVRV